MLDKVKRMVEKFREVEQKLSDPDIVKDVNKYREIMQEHSHLKEIVDCYEKYKEAESQIEDTKHLIAEEKDPEMKEMAKEELKELDETIENLNTELKHLLIPKDPLDRKNIIMEIRAGTGGDEAALFAANLFRMYSKYAETRKWKIEIMSSNEIGIGGFKEVVFQLQVKMFTKTSDTRAEFTEFREYRKQNQEEGYTLLP